jgi:hypothetical protein
LHYCIEHTAQSRERTVVSQRHEFNADPPLKKKNALVKSDR